MCNAKERDSAAFDVVSRCSLDNTSSHQSISVSSSSIDREHIQLIRHPYTPTMTDDMTTLYPRNRTDMQYPSLLVGVRFIGHAGDCSIL